MTTAEEAVENIVRLLNSAEAVTDLAVMAALNNLADSWQVLAMVLIERERI